MEMLIQLAHKWHISIAIMLGSIWYSFVSTAMPYLQCASLIVGLTVGLLTVYGKVLEIKKLHKDVSDTK